MADIEAGNLMRLVLTWDMPEEQTAQNVLGLGMTGGECTDAQLLTAAATWVSNAFATVQGIVHDQVDLVDADVSKVIWSGASWVTDRVIGSFIPTFAATDATQMLPHAVAGVITFPTIVPKKRGRVFVPGLSEGQQSDSLLVSGASTALGNLAVALRTGFSAGTGTVLYTILGILGQSHVSTGFRVNGLTGTQRRRKPGVGV